MNRFTIKISWDSGDGIQLVWNILSQKIASIWYNIITIPDYPSEVRAPIWTLEWVSSFQISFWNDGNIPPVHFVDLLIALNPAALKVNIDCIKEDTVILVNKDNFSEELFKKAWYENNPLDELKNKIYFLDINSDILELFADNEISETNKLKTKNFYILWILSSFFGIDLSFFEKYIEEKFIKNEQVLSFNKSALSKWKELAKIKYSIGDNFILEIINNNNIKKRIIDWNEAVALWLITWAKLANKKLFYWAYPITPATEIMYTLLENCSDDIVVFQAEDEIAAVSSAIWASFAWSLWTTWTSWPGFSLKTEAINLAVMAELPLVVIDVMRWWPSTWLPTKTEQSDLFQTMFWRHWDSSVVVIAVSWVEDCFNLAIEASKIAIKYMTPVIILSDSYISKSSSIFQVPLINNLSKFEEKKLPTKENFHPYIRDENLSRPWIYPWIEGYEHRIGWLEKDYEKWNISYNWDNHQLMTEIRQQKIEKIKNEIPETQIIWDKTWELLVIGWWSTYSSINNAVLQAINVWYRVSSIHLKYINPLPWDLDEIISKFDKILIPEGNNGQLKFILESKFKKEIIGLNKIKWQPIYEDEIYNKIIEILK